MTTRHDYETPWEVVRWLEWRFGKFDLDPCCSNETAKAPHYFTKESNGLHKNWYGNVFMNPPWDRINLPLFLEQAKSQALDKKVKLIAGLIPVRSDTSNWHDYIFNNGAHEVIFIKGRIKFFLDGVRQKSPDMKNVCAFPIWRPGPPPKTPKLHTVSVREFNRWPDSDGGWGED